LWGVDLNEGRELLMRCCLLLLAGACLAGADAKPKSEGGKGPLAVGANLPGPFLPYNVTGPQKGRFHCLVSDYALEPVVMLVARAGGGEDDLKPLGPLVEGLDSAIAKNPGARLHAFVVFLVDEKKDLVKDDDWRAEVASRYEKWAADLKPPPRHVVLALAKGSDLKKYGLKDEALNAVLYKDYKVVTSHAFPREKLKEATRTILDEVKGKLRVGK
jgi:hypothetical protein